MGEGIHSLGLSDKHSLPSLCRQEVKRLSLRVARASRESQGLA
jgi:hypothetical protein